MTVQDTDGPRIELRQRPSPSATSSEVHNEPNFHLKRTCNLVDDTLHQGISIANYTANKNSTNPDIHNIFSGLVHAARIFCSSSICAGENIPFGITKRARFMFDVREPPYDTLL